MARANGRVHDGGQGDGPSNQHVEHDAARPAQRHCLLPTSARLGVINEQTTAPRLLAKGESHTVVGVFLRAVLGQADGVGNRPCRNLARL